MEYDLSLREYWRIIKKRQFIILLSAVLAGGLSFTMAYVNRPAPLYETSATVKIEKTSTATGIYLEALSWSGADYLETQSSIITSYPIMEKVAKEMGLVDASLESMEIRSNADLIGTVLDIKGSVTATREGNSNLINITAQAENSKKAQEIANTVARVYTVEHTAEVNKRTYDARKFIEDQLKRVQEKMSEAEEAVRLFQEEENLYSLDNQTSSLLNRLTDNDAELLKLSKTIEDLSLVLKKLEAAKGTSVSAKESFHVNEAPPMYSELNGKLVNLLLEKEALLLTFTEEHPKVQEIDSKAGEIMSNMAATLKETLSSLTGREENLLRGVAQSQEKLNDLPHKKLTLARLEREVQLNEKVFALLESKLQEAKIMEAAKIEEVIIVKPALEPLHPLRQAQVMVKAVVGLVVGAVLGLIYAFIYETFDTSISAIKEAEEFIGRSVIGVVPAMDAKEIRDAAKNVFAGRDIGPDLLMRATQLLTHFIPHSGASESYRAIRANIQFAGVDRHLATIAFTSAVSEEGKSTTAVNTAISFAQGNNRVLLVEADLRKPSMGPWFGISRSPGLTEILLDSYHWKEVVQNVTDIMLGEMDVDDVMCTSGLDNLHLILSGNTPSNPAELLASEKLEEFLHAVRGEYDIIILDLPPILTAAETSIISAKADGVILVYKAGATARSALSLARGQLEHAHANLVGVVLNGLRAELSSDVGDLVYHRYGYGGSPPKKFSLATVGAWFAALLRESSPLQEEKDDEKGSPWLKAGILLAAVILLIVGLLWQGGGPP